MQIEKKKSLKFLLYHQKNFPILLWDNPALWCAVRFNMELKPAGSWKHVCLKKTCYAAEVSRPLPQGSLFSHLAARSRQDEK